MGGLRACPMCQEDSLRTSMYGTPQAVCCNIRCPSEGEWFPLEGTLVSFMKEIASLRRINRHLDMLVQGAPHRDREVLYVEVGRLSMSEARQALLDAERRLRRGRNP